MKFILIIFIFLNFSCSFDQNINKDTSLLDSKNNSFYFKSPSLNDFLLKIKKYTEESKYPNLEN